MSQSSSSPNIATPSAMSQRQSAAQTTQRCSMVASHTAGTPRVGRGIHDGRSRSAARDRCGLRRAEPSAPAAGSSSISSFRGIPIRLEQRIGRVDRIGQTRTVHAINLFAAGTAEGEVLARLPRRLERIRTSEIELAACVIDRCRTGSQTGNDRRPAPPQRMCAISERRGACALRELATSKPDRMIDSAKAWCPSRLWRFGVLQRERRSSRSCALES